MQIGDELAERVAEPGDRLPRVRSQLTQDRAAAQDLEQKAAARL